MQITDPIADMLTQHPQRAEARHETVDVPSLEDEEGHSPDPADEGHSATSSLSTTAQGIIRITLSISPARRGPSGPPAVSKPGLRVYAGADKLAPRSEGASA